MTDETRERIIIALRRLVDETEAEIPRRRSMIATASIGSRRIALLDAITIVRNTP